jgi:glycosyltransferase involved in cell wall biosynthesis
MSADVRTLTVVCPVYNEEGVILAFHAELGRALAAVAGRWSWSVIYVVDRGTDRTLDLLRGLAAADRSLRVLALSSHFGQQASLLAGLDHCDADAVVMMDCDLQHPPALIPELLDAYEKGHDVVYTVREDTPEIPLVKRLTARWFYRLVNAISETPIREGAADFRLVSRRVVEVFQHHIRERGLFLRGLFSWVGFPSCPVRFRVGARRAGRTKYSLARMLRFGTGGVVAFSRVPLRAALALGALLGALGTVALAAGLARWLAGGEPLVSEETLAGLLVGCAGVQLVFLGVLGEYLGAVLDEVKARPHYIVEERINLGAPGAASAGSSPATETAAPGRLPRA